MVRMIMQPTGVLLKRLSIYRTISLFLSAFLSHSLCLSSVYLQVGILTAIQAWRRASKARGRRRRADLSVLLLRLGSTRRDERLWICWVK